MKLLHRRDLLIGDDPHPIDADWPRKTDRRGRYPLYRRVVGKRQNARAQQASQLDLVERSIATKEDRDGNAVGDIDQCLDQIRLRRPQRTGDLADRPRTRRRDHLQRLLAAVRNRNHLGRGDGATLGVRRIAADGTFENGVLARLGDRHELVVLQVADRPAVRLDRQDGQTDAAERVDRRHSRVCGRRHPSRPRPGRTSRRRT